jgi:hypothetical protein
MMLLIATGIDANGQILPLAWALVATENTKWWKWFCKFLEARFPGLRAKDHVFISDREKGIFEAILMSSLKALQLIVISISLIMFNRNLGLLLGITFGKSLEPLFKRILTRL